MKNISLDKEKINDIGTIIDSTGLILIGLFSLGYCLFSRRFAELHISFFFLDFPVFVGEVLLFLCFTLLLIKWKFRPEKFTGWHYLIFSYFGFVLMKTSLGYLRWGPLAFRHSALFYYPLFAVFGYSFYRKSFFINKKINFLIPLLFIFILRFTDFYNYFVLTCFILAFVLINAQNQKVIKYPLLVLLLIATPFKQLFLTSRMMLISNLLVMVYFAIAVFFILRIKMIYRIVAASVFILFISSGILMIADTNAVKSLIKCRDLIDLYHTYNKVIASRKDDFVMRELKEVRLYNKEEKSLLAFKSEPLVFLSSGIEKQPETKEASLKMSEDTEKQPETKEASLKMLEDKEQQRVDKKQKQQVVAEKPLLRSFETAQGNSLFRIFIWKDVLSQIKNEKPVFGFDFGKPFRSKNIEILGWAPGEWERDGWVATHNSYLDILYRAGVMGIIFILTVFIVLFWMIKEFLDIRSVTGILLCGVLINWLMAANFLEILELPYNAIIIWSLFGMTLAYLNKYKIKINNESTGNP